jgi:hypothetical protein
VFFKVILGERVTLSDLRYIDPQEYSSLAAMMALPSIDGVIFNTFCYEDAPPEGAPAGTPPKITNLIPGGHRVAVTDANRGEYAALKAQHILFRAAEAQLDRVCDGFYAVVPRDAIEACGLRARELRAMLCGAAEIDIEALRQHTTYRAPYSGEHQVIKWLWEVMREATLAQRLAFLSFVTAADAMPLGGFGLLGTPPFEIRLVIGGSDSPPRLPGSHTCFRILVRSSVQCTPTHQCVCAAPPCCSRKLCPAVVAPGFAVLPQQGGAAGQGAAGHRVPRLRPGVNARWVAHTRTHTHTHARVHADTHTDRAHRV